MSLMCVTLQGQQAASQSEAKIFWEKKGVNFNDIPFTIDKNIVYDCQYGDHYFKPRESKHSRLRLQGTRKISCSAHIQSIKYTLYPEYKIGEEALSNGSKWKLRQIREKKLEQLRGDGSPKTVTKWFVSLPTNEAHTNHPTGTDIAFAQKIHPLLAKKITELVSANITDVHEVKKLLKNYTNTDISKELGFRPQVHDRAFNPSIVDIKNYVYQAKKALELSKMDQENLRLKIEQWKSDSNSNFFFRPYVEMDHNSASESNSFPKEQREKPDNCFNSNSGCDDSDWCEVLGSQDKCSQTFLYVHQTDWQQKLLNRYGNNISLIDATYKTTRYDLALFFICVRTNVGYSVVAEFITQSKTTGAIGEALGQLRKWNPLWKPKYFMTDYSEAELLALEQSFPATQIYLCDFHREQAWERWSKQSKHGLSDGDRQSLLHLLRECANAPSASPESGKRTDAHYQQALKDLKDSTVWKNNEDVRIWLNTNWLPISQVC